MYFCRENRHDQPRVNLYKNPTDLGRGLPKSNSSQDPKYGLGGVLALWVVRRKYNLLTPIIKATSPLVD